MDRRQGGNGLDLNEDEIFNHQISTETLFELAAAKPNGNRLLTNDFKAFGSEHVRQKEFIDAFQKAWPELLVKMESFVDDDRGDDVFPHRRQIWQCLIHRAKHASEFDRCEPDVDLTRDGWVQPQGVGVSRKDAEAPRGEEKLGVKKGLVG